MHGILRLHGLHIHPDKRCLSEVIGLLGVWTVSCCKRPLLLLWLDLQTQQLVSRRENESGKIYAFDDYGGPHQDAKVLNNNSSAALLP
jgi:hypothetical protein